MPGLQSIQGLASSLDITSIVDTIIKSERIPVTFLEAEKELKTKQVAAYQAVLAKFLALKTQSSALVKAATFDKWNIGVSDDSVLSATVTGKATAGSYRLRVLSLASNHQLASQGFDSATEAIFGTGSINLSVGDGSQRTIEIVPGSNTLVGIKDAINSARVGVTASVINDGTSSRPYRLLLTADATGSQKQIHFDAALTGGDTIDLVNSSFDNPEEVSMASSSSANVSLGATSLYSGNQNKTYTFTVAGTGVQTIGSNNITLNWSDGTNTGSILVTQADLEYELSGVGADGLKLSFSSGALTGGDSFQVTAFAPLLQAAADARVAIGSDGTGSGSPIVINSASNTFDSLIPGVKIDVKKVTDPGASVTIKTDIDIAGIKQALSSFVDKYNDVMDFIDDQFTYNKDTKESGVLFSDYSLQVMQSTLRGVTTSVTKEITGNINSLAAIGIRSDTGGRLSLANSARLTDLIMNDLGNLKNLFVDSAVSSTPFIEFLSAGVKTVSGEDYAVNITQAATKGYFQGMTIADPTVTPITLDSTNNIIKLRVDGIVSNEMALDARSYHSGEELAEEIQTRLNADAKVGSRGVTVEWVDLGNTGFLKLTSGTYGSNSRVDLITSVTNTAYNLIGLTGGLARAGNDVAGTINGEVATGSGQILAGKEGNRTTAGLKLKITLTGGDVTNGDEGTISFVKGLASRIDKVLDNVTKSIDGSVARRTTALNNQIEELNKQIKDYDERLVTRRDDLYQQFWAMEEAISRMQSEGSYLETQLANLGSNLKQMTQKND